MADLDPGQIGPGGIPVVTSMPDAIYRHNVSDEDLDVLCDPSRDELWELKWAALGSGLAALPSSGQALWNYAHSAQGQLAVLDLIQVVITVVALAVWFVLRFVVQQKTAKSHTRRDAIRARTKRFNEGAGNGAIN